MNKTIKTTLTSSALIAGAALLSGCSMFSGEIKEDSGVIPFQTISSGAYSGTVKNWDNKQQPVLCTLIRSQSEWEYWFQPTQALNSAKRKLPLRSQDALAPKAEYFETRQLLLATRVIQAPDSNERGQVFTPESVIMKNGVLTLRYRFSSPASGATYDVKDFLLVEIPKESYTTGPVRFVENGQNVCDISR